MHKPKRNPKLAVVALGGNMLLRSGEAGTIEQQTANCRQTVQYLLPLLDRGVNIVLTHGNGPQVGNILVKNEKTRNLLPSMPLDVLVSDTQGSIGYILQQALLNELHRRGIRRDVVTLITQVLVDPRDPAFRKPSKPVGPFYTCRRARQLARGGWEMVEDAGRGFRRVVPSPRPVEILQKEMIRRLAMDGHIVVAVGGGGIPVMKRGRDYLGVEAVIDKDRASALLAREIGAGLFVILTGVPKVAIHYGTPEQRELDTMDLAEARRHLVDGQFPGGSMGPKIEAAIAYVAEGGGRVLITDPASLERAFQGRGGTAVVARNGGRR